MSLFKEKISKTGYFQIRVFNVGRPEIEECMICQNYILKLHSIERCDEGSGDVIGPQLLCSSGSGSMDRSTSCYVDH